jgi:hypothetical protein
VIQAWGYGPDVISEIERTITNVALADAGTHDAKYVVALQDSGSRPVCWCGEPRLARVRTG